MSDETTACTRALYAFAMDRWGTTNPILVSDDERELQRLYFAAIDNLPVPEDES